MTNLDGANSEPKILNTIYFEKDLEMIYHLFMQPVGINIKRGPQNDHSCEVQLIPSKKFHRRCKSDNGYRQQTPYDNGQQKKTGHNSSR